MFVKLNTFHRAAAAAADDDLEREDEVSRLPDDDCVQKLLERKFNRVKEMARNDGNSN